MSPISVNTNTRTAQRNSTRSYELSTDQGPQEARASRGKLQDQADLGSNPGPAAADQAHGGGRAVQDAALYGNLGTCQGSPGTMVNFGDGVSRRHWVAWWGLSPLLRTPARVVSFLCFIGCNSFQLLFQEKATYPNKAHGNHAWRDSRCPWGTGRVDCCRPLLRSAITGA